MVAGTRALWLVHPHGLHARSPRLRRTFRYLLLKFE